MRVGTLFSYLFDNFDVLALILAEYVACSCNRFNIVMFWKKILPCQECNTKNLKSEKLSVFFLNKHTQIKREENSVNKISIFLNENFIYYIVYINNVMRV
jgi:hypothetical protein